MPQAKEPTPTAAPRAASRPAADSKNMLPPRERRRSPFERVFVRIIATAGIVGIGVVIAAILASSHTQGWIIGLVVSIVSVVLAAVLWSSRQL
jgi:protein-S-isoprenylcysteine O-methyltransferase Ste14